MKTWIAVLAMMAAAAGASAQDMAEPASPMVLGTMGLAQAAQAATAATKAASRIKEASVQLSPEDMKAFDALLARSPEQTVLAKVADKDYGLLRGQATRASDGGLFLVLTLPPAYQEDPRGGQVVKSYLLRVAPSGRGALRAREVLFDEGCQDPAACEPSGSRLAALPPSEAERALALIKKFWTSAGRW